MCLTQQQLHHPMAIVLKPVLLLLVEPRRLSAQQMDQMIACCPEAWQSQS